MSYNRRGDGFFQPSLSLLNDQEKYCKELKDKSRHTPTAQHEYLLHMMTDIHSGMYQEQQNILQKACERVALSFMIEQSDYAELLLTEDEFEKASAVFARKQYGSKILQKLLDYFSQLLSISNERERLPIYFYSDIMREYQEIEEDITTKEFAPLKKKIASIASGVKASCYLRHNHRFPLQEKYLPEKWNEFLKSKTGYDYNHQFDGNNKMSTIMYGSEDRIMVILWKKCLLDDSEFWQQRETFSVFSFLEAVEKQNSKRHAEKIFEHMYSKLIKLPNIKLLMENNLPLYIANIPDIIVGLEHQAHRFTFAGLQPYYKNLDVLDAEPLCVPMSTVSKEKLQIGEQVFRNWMCAYNYPHDGEKVIAYLQSEVNRFVNGETKQNEDVAVIMDGAKFRYSTDSVDRRTFKLYFPECFSAENIWNRLYATAYAVTKLTDDEKAQFDSLNRIYIDLVNIVEIKLGICTAQRTDFISRDKEYNAFKLKMAEFGIAINDAHKNDYILALLDRETATLKEAERFPELEQLGDAVYGFAVAERLFYQPAELHDFSKTIEKYTCASAQVELSKHHGFDKLYLHSGLSGKYEDYGTYGCAADPYVLGKVSDQSKSSQKYLADSLEMIIGVLCIDQGVNTAIDFTKRLLEEHFTEDFAHPEMRDARENRSTVTDMDYWERILPCPNDCTYGDNIHLSFAFNKLLVALSLGTDDKDKRNFITHNVISIGYELSKWMFFDYLHKGLDYVLFEYRNMVLESYNQKNKH